MDSQILRGPDIRNRNEKLVLYSIYVSDGIAQSEVSKLTGLKPPTVLGIFSHLAEQGMIEIFSERKGTPDRKGRKPVFYRTRADAFYTIGIDFWMDSAVLIILDFRGTPIHQSAILLGSDLDADAVTDRLLTLIRTAMSSIDLPQEKLLGIGIGGPGRVDVAQGRIFYYADIPGMIDYDLRDRLERELGVQVIVHNNVAVIAASEYRYGKEPKFETLIAVSIRAGVGGAMISGGKIFLNRNRTALDVGHMSVDIRGRECSCGSRGCLSTYITERRIMEDLKPHCGIDHFEDLDAVIAMGDSDGHEYTRRKSGKFSLSVSEISSSYSVLSFLSLSRVPPRSLRSLRRPLNGRSIPIRLHGRETAVRFSRRSTIRY